ncbi:hypothetical protein H5410_062909 [Solanum commersonii]|uniref:RING-type E3 ubiquitin transferase n=1 Tax=Solanum commersonii TaxID=4109 RepID=A0A9J5WCU9_SOLCO|nr:hypothetical protein H5410_062909 [Solanum commersonii]
MRKNWFTVISNSHRIAVTKDGTIRIGLITGGGVATFGEKEDDAILLGYFKTSIHRVAEGVNNATETKEICAICQAEFEHEESIGTLGCGHEYHTGCIKQWLLRKNDCPMCRASVLP